MIWENLDRTTRSQISLVAAALGICLLFCNHIFDSLILMPEFGLLLFFIIEIGIPVAFIFVIAYSIPALTFYTGQSVQWVECLALWINVITFLLAIQWTKKQKYQQQVLVLFLIALGLFSCLFIGSLMLIWHQPFETIARTFFEIIITQSFFLVLLHTKSTPLTAQSSLAGITLSLILLASLFYKNFLSLAFIALYLCNYFFKGTFISIVCMMTYLYFTIEPIYISLPYLETLTCITLFVVCINFFKNDREGENSLINIDWLAHETEVVIKEIAEYKKLANIINYSPIVAFLWKATPHREIEYVSKNTKEIGYSSKLTHSNPKNMHYQNMIFDEDKSFVTEKIQKLLIEKKDIRMEYRIFSQKKEILWVVERSFAKLDENGEVTHIQGTVMNITESKQAEDRLNRLTYYDELTGLSNRIAFIHALQKRIDDSEDLDSFALLIIDIDNFKKINDSFGHEKGDEVLCILAKRMQHFTKSLNIFLARKANDNFVLLIPSFKIITEIHHIAEQLLALISKPIDIVGRTYRLTATIGIATYPNDGQDVNTLLSNVDVALYEAKSYGRNNYLSYNKEMRRHAQQDLTLIADLQLAYEKEEFTLYYQPKINLKNGLVSGVEVLIRWEHPIRGIISPVEFIPLAEDTGLIIELGAWITRKACEALVNWHQLGLADFRISVNLSPRQFCDPNFLHLIKSILSETGLKADLLELEITENLVMRDPDQNRLVMQKLREHGVHIAIDDFGVGQSSLNHIKRFPIDSIKIDRSFIIDLPDDEEARGISKAIVEMGSALNVCVVAEGVETIAQINFLKSLGCDEVQGFFYSKPLPESDFLIWLKNYQNDIQL